MNFYPLILTPPVKDYIWGGTRLKSEYGIETDLEKCAEGWMLSCHKDAPSIVANGEHAGKTLPEVLDICGKAALGIAVKTEEFPLLIKLIDAADRLSVQVHPDDDYAYKNEGEPGKTEMWYVIDCDEDAELIYGFNEDITKQEFERRIADNTLLEVCNRVKVKPDDVFFIKSGTLHAIGKGMLIAEVQQNSNTTYRVYDYGRPRELHIKKALDVTNLIASDYERKPLDERVICGDSSITVAELCECDKFYAERITINDSTLIFGNENSFVSITVLEGDGVLTDIFGQNEILLKKGMSIFIPATYRVNLKGKLKLLTAGMPF